MDQDLRVEEPEAPEVYEPPVLAEAGTFVEATHGPFGDLAEGWDSYYQTW